MSDDVKVELNVSGDGWENLSRLVREGSINIQRGETVERRPWSWSAPTIPDHVRFVQADRDDEMYMRLKTGRWARWRRPASGQWYATSRRVTSAELFFAGTLREVPDPRKDTTP